MKKKSAVIASAASVIWFLFCGIKFCYAEPSNWEQAQVAALVASPGVWPLRPKPLDGWIARYYAEHGYNPLFHQGSELSEKARILMRRLGHVRSEGMNPEDFRYSSLYLRYGYARRADLGVLDFLLTQAGVEYAMRLMGYREEQLGEQGFPIVRRTIDAFLNEPYLDDLFTRLAPQHRFYQNLLNYLQRDDLSEVDRLIVSQGLDWWRQKPWAPREGELVFNTAAGEFSLLGSKAAEISGHFQGTLPEGMIKIIGFDRNAKALKGEFGTVKPDHLDRIIESYETEGNTLVKPIWGYALAMPAWVDDQGVLRRPRL